MTIDQLEYERRDNPICKICGYHLEKWKQARKKGNVCNTCTRNDAKVKRLNKQKTTR